MRLFRSPSPKELRTLARDISISNRDPPNYKLQDGLGSIRRQKIAAAR